MKIWLPVKSAALVSITSITQVMQYLVEVPYASMGNSLVTNWKEDPTPAFLVSKRSKSHQFLAIAFCMNSQQTFRKKNIQKRSLQMASPSNWQFSRIFFFFFFVKSWLGFLNLDSACIEYKKKLLSWKISS